MYSPPLHRRLLPWVYVVTFFLVAPMVIFYTSGYRYNSKKATIEKRGTLLTDSTPTGASIWIDGQPTNSETPAVFQELTPGFHQIRFQKDQYLPWEKTLEIKPERVTFANEAHLWLANPVMQMVATGTFSMLSANPDRDTLVTIESNPSTQEQRIILLQAKGRQTINAPLRDSVSTTTIAHWQADSRAVALTTTSSHDLLVGFVGTTITTTSTPSDGLWSGNDFLSPEASDMWRWNSRTGTSIKEALPTTTREKIGDFSLEQTTNRTTQLLFDRTFQQRAFSLPDGHWRFADQLGNTLLLQSDNRWLGVDPRQTKPFLGTVEGDTPRWFSRDAQNPSALFLRNNELWLWNVGQNPVLLLRQSDPLRAAAWEASGTAVLFADGHTVTILDLDERGGRSQYPIGTFDRINGMDTLGKTVFVSGVKDGVSGIWTITIE